MGHVEVGHRWDRVAMDLLDMSVTTRWTASPDGRRHASLPDKTAHSVADAFFSISSPHAVWVRDALGVAYEQVRRHSGQVVQRQKRLYDRRAVRRIFAVGDWVLRYYTPAKKCKLDSAWIGPYLVVL